MLGDGLHESGTDMFGFSNPEVDKLVQVRIIRNLLFLYGSFRPSSYRH